MTVYPALLFGCFHKLLTISCVMPNLSLCMSTVRQAQGDGKDQELPQLCARTVLRHYNERCPDKLPIVQQLLKAQGVLPDAA